MNRREQAAWLLARLAEAHAPRKVGDVVKSWSGRSTSTIVKIEGEIVTLANGESMHRSKVRS